MPLPPRVLWSFIQLLLSGWITSRRFQQTAPCLFCQGHIDSIEHFRICLVVGHVYSSFALPHDLLLLQTPTHRTKDSLFLLHCLHIYHNNRRRGLPPSPNLPRTILRHLFAEGYPLRLITSQVTPPAPPAASLLALSTLPLTRSGGTDSPTQVPAPPPLHPLAAEPFNRGIPFPSLTPV